MHSSLAVITTDSSCRYFRHEEQALIFAILSSPQTQNQLSSQKPTFFLICIVGGGVQTGSTRHVGHFNLGLLYLPGVIVRMEILVE
jgi:hypothetical protein